MSRTIKIVVIMLAVFTLFAQDSYALWGRKKTTKTQKEEVQEKKEVPVQAKQVDEKQEIKKEAKKEEKIKVEKKEVKKTPVAEKKVDKKALKAKKKMKLQRDKKRSQINNTQWDITMNLMGAKGKPRQGVPIFEEKRFYAEKTSKEGFNATNYTISVQDDGVVIWETMQTAEEGRINFWRGEIAEDMKNMRGIVSKQLPDGTTENYSFSSQGKKIINK